MLLNKGMITEEMVKMLSGWRHSGFNVFCDYGFYSSVSRGKRQMEGSDDAAPCILIPQAKGIAALDF